MSNRKTAVDPHEELRDLIRQAHAAAKDLRAATLEARRTVPALATAEVQRRVTVMIEGAMGQLVVDLDKVLDRRVGEVRAHFEKLMRLLHEGDGKRITVDDIVAFEVLGRKMAAERQRLQVVDTTQDRRVHITSDETAG